jgi:hypothetical protein
MQTPKKKSAMFLKSYFTLEHNQKIITQNTKYIPFATLPHGNLLWSGENMVDNPKN